MPKSSGPKKEVVTLKHEEASRRNIPTAEFQSAMQPEELNPVALTYELNAKGLQQEKGQRNRDLDPQLVWRGISRTGPTWWYKLRPTANSGTWFD